MKRLPFTPFLLAGIAYYFVASFIYYAPRIGDLNNKALNNPGYEKSAKEGCLALVRRLPVNTPIYSTNPAAIWVYTGRVTKNLYNQVFVYRDKQSLQSAIDEPRKTGGCVLWFRAVSSGYIQPREYLDLMEHRDSVVVGWQDGVTELMTLLKVAQ